MRGKVLAATLAGGLVVGAGFAAAAVSPPGAAAAQEEGKETQDVKHSSGHGALLEEVLADLVSEGTITQEQADAITEALGTKADEIKAENQELRELISGFLEDGVITADELAQLPEGHIFNDPDSPYADAVADGELTREEISRVMSQPRRDLFKRGARFGALLDDGGIDKEEYDALSDDHPLKQIDASEYLVDGVITIDELRQIRQSQESLGDSA